jgi:hypothetical protein
MNHIQAGIVNDNDGVNGTTWITHKPTQVMNS